LSKFIFFISQIKNTKTGHVHRDNNKYSGPLPWAGYL